MLVDQPSSAIRPQENGSRSAPPKRYRHALVSDEEPDVEPRHHQAAAWRPRRPSGSTRSRRCATPAPTRTRTASIAPTRSSSSVLQFETLEPGTETDQRVTVAGRMMLRREQGKLIFATLVDRGGEVQLFVSKAVVGDEGFAAFGEFDLGDWLGAEGTVMTTRKGELSVKVDRVELLSKAVRPMPDKWHGLTDTDTRFRQRYADLIVNEEARRAFRIRHEIIASFRRTLHVRGLHRGRDAGAAPRGRRRTCPAVRHPPQHARHAAVPAHRAGAAPQAADRRRHGAGVRDRSDLPQRGHLHAPQSRVHDDGAVSGVRRLLGDDRHHRALDHTGRHRRDRHIGRRRSATSRSISPSRGGGRG